MALFTHNLLDLAVVALPLLRPLRLVRLLALLSILNRTGARQLHGRVITYTAGATVLLIVMGALAITDAERGQPGSSIGNSVTVSGGRSPPSPPSATATPVR